MRVSLEGDLLNTSFGPFGDLESDDNLIRFEGLDPVCHLHSIVSLREVESPNQFRILLHLSRLRIERVDKGHFLLDIIQLDLLVSLDHDVFDRGFFNDNEDDLFSLGGRLDIDLDIGKKPRAKMDRRSSRTWSMEKVRLRDS